MNTNSNKSQNADTIAAFLFIQRLTHDIKESDIKSPLDKLVFDIRKLLGSRVNILTNKFLSIKNLNKDNIKQYINSFNPKGYNGFKRMEDKLNEGDMDILDKIKMIVESVETMKAAQIKSHNLKHIGNDRYEDRSGLKYFWDDKKKSFVHEMNGRTKINQKLETDDDLMDRKAKENGLTHVKNLYFKNPKGKIFKWTDDLKFVTHPSYQDVK